MKQAKTYEANDRMIDLIRDNYDILQSLSAFGIPLGFADSTVDETCRRAGVDTTTFLAVVNFTINGASNINPDDLSVATLLHYLEACHRYYIDYQLPSVRKELAECIDIKAHAMEGTVGLRPAAASDSQAEASAQNAHIGKLILKVYDEYAREIRNHMRYEERMLFPYVEKLLKGEISGGYSIAEFAKQHAEADKSLRELKQMIIKYLPSDQSSNALISALYHIYNNEEWLANHQEVENRLFVPQVQRLEQKLKSERLNSAISAFANADANPDTESLTDREKEVVLAVVRGMSNKEIAEHLYISPNTVLTHRKNIARKLQIHTPAGLTIYAISTGLLDLNAMG